MKFTTKNFYKSKEWEEFRKIVIQNKMNPVDGFVYCEHCGKPILKAYDCIVHHKIELDDSNINDYNISLNPNLMEVVHFKCHNEIHHRFQGGYKPPLKKVYIVYGAPCSGKTTWVRDNATENDIVVDMDSIWQMVSVNERYQKPERLKAVVFEVRDKMYDIIKYRLGKWWNAYIITGGALEGDRERLKARVGADDFIFIDTSKEECMERSIGRGAEWRNHITDWFDRFQPSSPSHE